LRVHAKPVSELLDDHIKDQLGQFFLAVGASQQRTAVQHDPGGPVMKLGQVGKPGQVCRPDRSVAW